MEVKTPFQHLKMPQLPMLGNTWNFGIPIYYNIVYLGITYMTSPLNLQNKNINTDLPILC